MKLWSGLLPFVTLIISTNSYANQLSWLAEYGRANGSGCEAGGSRAADTFFLANGGDLSVVFSSLGFSYPSGSEGPLSDLRSCSIQVPLALAPGVKSEQLSQTLSFGIVKSEGASAQLNFSSKLFGLQSDLTGFYFGPGPNVQMPIGVRSSSLDLRSAGANTNHCRGGVASYYNYTADFALNGSRAGLNDDLVVSNDALDIRLEVDTQTASCPFVLPPVDTTRCVWKGQSYVNGSYMGRWYSSMTCGSDTLYCYDGKVRNALTSQGYNYTPYEDVMQRQSCNPAEPIEPLTCPSSVCAGGFCPADYVYCYADGSHQRCHPGVGTMSGWTPIQRRSGVCGSL